MMIRTSAEEPATAPSGALAPETKPLAVSIPEFCRLTSIGRTHAYSMIRDQRVETRQIGRRTVVLMRSIETLLELNQKRA